MRKLLLLIAGLCAIGGLALALTSEAEDRSADIADAIVTAELNEGLADSAPQQQVVNGWAAKDLLEIQARQLNEIASAQHKTMVILALVGFTFAIGMAASVAAPRVSNLVGPATPPAPSIGDDQPARR